MLITHLNDSKSLENYISEEYVNCYYSRCGIHVNEIVDINSFFSGSILCLFFHSAKSKSIKCSVIINYVIYFSLLPQLFDFFLFPSLLAFILPSFLLFLFSFFVIKSLSKYLLKKIFWHVYWGYLYDPNL